MDESVTFYCTVQGRPEPAITWYHNGEDITQNPHKYQVQNFRLSNSSTGIDGIYTVQSSVTILSVSNEDSGSVSCKASVSPDGTEPAIEQRSANLSVLGKYGTHAYNPSKTKL